MLIFYAPGLHAKRTLPPGATAVSALEGLIEAAYSKLPEHAAARDQVVALNLRSLDLARGLQDALPDSLHEFWEAYSGWFAMYSLGPLLGNACVGAQALSDHPDTRALIRENWRDPGWWSGRGMLQPALWDCLKGAGLQTFVYPGWPLQALRGPLARLVARRAGGRALAQERCLPHHAVAASLEPTDVLWLSLGASSADLLARLVPALADRHQLRSQILDFHYFGSNQALERHQLPYTDIAHFTTADALAAGERVRRSVPRWWREIERLALRLPLREQLPPRLFASVLDRLRVVLLRDAAAWVGHAAAAHEALAAYRPQVVVGTHVYGAPIAPLIVAATRQGLPTVCLQHGVIGPRYLALPALPYSEQLLFGDYPAQILRQTCPPQTRLTVTGHCLYDVAEAPAQPRPEVLALREGYRGLVVLCTQFNEDVYYQAHGWWLAEVAEACRQLGVRLVLKLHPSDSPANLQRYETVLRPGDASVLLAPHGRWPLSELLAACDLMVTRDSTVVFEANLLDKPSLTVNLSQWDEELPYSATGGARGVYTLADLRPALEALLFDPSARTALAATRADFLRSQTGPRDGRATERITRAIAAWTTRH